MLAFHSDNLPAVLLTLETTGSVIIEEAFTFEEVDRIKGIIQRYFDSHPDQLNKQVYAIRQLLIELPELKELLLNERVKKIVTLYSSQSFISKALFFDKPPASNWYVSWHQDVPINVVEKIETAGFSGWTQKGAVTSVCPPDEILHKTITVRIHLDDTDQQNGALKILPGSHQRRLNDSEIDDLIEKEVPVICEVKSGGVHLMKPLLLHASSRGVNEQHRRVIHLEFNSVDLPGELEWSEREKVGI